MELFKRLVPTASAASNTDEITEPQTGIKFAQLAVFQGLPYRCLGVGAREFMWVNVYGAAFYIEPVGFELAFADFLQDHGQAFRSSAGLDLPRLATSPKVLEWIRSAPCARVFQAVFVRDVPGDKSSAVFTKALGENLGNLNAPDIKQDARLFIDQAGHPISKGAQMTVHFSAEAEMLVEFTGREPLRINNPKVAWGVMGAWFGPKPISRSLQRGLIARLPQIVVPLTRPVQASVTTRERPRV